MEAHTIEGTCFHLHVRHEPGVIERARGLVQPVGDITYSEYTLALLKQLDRKYPRKLHNSTLHQLSHLILDRHPAQQILDALVDRCTGILVDWRALACDRSNERRKQQAASKTLDHHPG